MPFRPHTRVTLQGEIFSGSTVLDIWSCNINVVRNLLFGPLDDPAAYLEQIAAPMAAWFTGATHRMRNDVRLTQLKVNNIGADGKYSDPGHPHTNAYGPLVVGGSVTVDTPPMCSLAWSWTTSLFRGPGHTGRIYPPNALLGTTAANSKVTSGEAGTHVTAAKALLDVLRNTGGILASPCVSSAVLEDNVLITGVRVGDVIDVQRRRKNAEVETYSASAWP